MQDVEAARHYGTNELPLVIGLGGGRYHFCAWHARLTRAWLAAEAQESAL